MYVPCQIPRKTKNTSHFQSRKTAIFPFQQERMEWQRGRHFPTTIFDWFRTDFDSTSFPSPPPSSPFRRNDLVSTRIERKGGRRRRKGGKKVFFLFDFSLFADHLGDISFSFLSSSYLRDDP